MSRDEMSRLILVQDRTPLSVKAVGELEDDKLVLRFHNTARDVQLALRTAIAVSAEVEAVDHHIPAFEAGHVEM